MLFNEKIGQSLTLKFAQTAAERRRKGLPIISLGLGEPDFNVPEEVIKSTIDVLTHTHAGYSDPMGVYSFREKIVHKLKTENSINCSEDNILVSAGAKQAFQIICMAILEPEDEVIVINPSFVSFIPQFYIAEPNCKVIAVDINKVDFTLDLDRLKHSISSKTKLLVINSPNNPSGYIFDKEILSVIYKLSAENGFYVISDEVYERLIFSNEKHFSIGSYESEPKRVITINSFSKSHAMTGWRLGYACLPVEIRNRVLKLQQHINTNTCTFIQHALAQSFDSNIEYLTDYIKKLAQRSKYISGVVKKMDSVNLVAPLGGFFAFINISKLNMDSNTFCSQLIEKTGVATTPGIAFGDGWDDHVRISFATAEDNLRLGLGLINDYINQL